MRLTWVQPEDLVGHAFAQAAEDGVDVADLRSRWVAAGGDPAPIRSGASGRPTTAELRVLAGELLDEVDRRPSPFAASEPTSLDGLVPGPVAAPAFDRVHGAWLGRAAGCLLGKPVEKVSRAGIREILEATGRWPLDDWFTAKDLPADVAARWPWNRRSALTSLAENIDGMPEDDDLNFPMLNLALLETKGAEFTTEDVAESWLASLPAGRVFTAERVAYRNLLLGHLPPATARVRNPFRDWIGAQIRGDVFGWVRPGDPAGAAALAGRDAVLSHTRNGVYGELFVAAACASSLVVKTVDEVLDAGLSVLPPSSRYAEAVRFARSVAGGEDDWEAVVDAVEARYGHLHWVHVLNNAALVVAALVHGGGDYERSITAVVSGGWDTDSNGATVGSIVGGLTGAAGLPWRWTEPLRNRVSTSLAGFDGIGFDTLAARTVAVAEALA